MADPLRFTIVCRYRRRIIAAIRGYGLELADPTPGATDDLDPAEQATAFEHLKGDGLGKPTDISAPIPAIGGQRLCAWGLWQSMLSPAQRADAIARAALRPTLVRVYEQAEGETENAYEARWKADCLWINRPRTV